MAACGLKLIRHSFKRVTVIANVAASIPERPFALRHVCCASSSVCFKARELIKVYGIGEGAVKAFCSNCGSSLFGGDWPDGPQVSIRMGRSMLIPEFGRNFIRSSPIARRGIRSPMIFHSIRNDGLRGNPFSSVELASP